MEITESAIVSKWAKITSVTGMLRHDTYRSIGMSFRQNGIRDAGKPVIMLEFNNTISDIFYSIL